MPDNFSRMIGRQVTKHRVAQGRSVEALARELGISGSDLDRIEVGEQQPSATQIVRLATVLHVRISDLLGVDGAPPTVSELARAVDEIEDPALREQVRDLPFGRPKA